MTHRTIIILKNKKKHEHKAKKMKQLGTDKGLEGGAERQQTAVCSKALDAGALESPVFRNDGTK